MIYKSLDEIIRQRLEMVRSLINTLRVLRNGKETNPDTERTITAYYHEAWALEGILRDFESQFETNQVG